MLLNSYSVPLSPVSQHPIPGWLFSTRWSARAKSAMLEAGTAPSSSCLEAKVPARVIIQQTRAAL